MKLTNFNKCKNNHKRCYETHPTYYIDGLPITGGTCLVMYPKVDVFIGLDQSMFLGERRLPWVSGVDILYPIKDMGVPTNVKEFTKLLRYVEECMRDGLSVHVGCIGGHGRTGLFFSALTKIMAGDTDATNTVRDNYCKKAVESKRQVEWLHNNYAIKKVKPIKDWGGVGDYTYGSDLLE